ncbi:hypothetical protein AGOR_G00220690 [Albula goreensis]|uniref:Wbp11/ELF5/Saf1 N-terminal domain-containing protein n=1 Tax=Albula goreensis TaxID=1534307 RepID=A0A8T3CM86_9TELE|nr:hypothetical protein AGOR_G00220690 [Albula goreensis]
MGRRSTSSTKSGKFMNPTDQARKEARKRELKKNKKQRMMVRTAVLKMKDPRQIIRDMEKLDEMEFNPVQVPLLNEKVLRDKRKKLRETFERIVRLYERENPDTYKELRKLELDYESKRGQLALYFHSVKNAEAVEVDSIPLPDMPHAPSSILIQDIPLPGAQPPSILKKSGAFGKGSFAAPAAPSAAEVAGVPRLPPGRKPPGPPPGPPPPQVLQLYRAKAQNYSADMGLEDAVDPNSDSEVAMETRESGSESEGDIEDDESDSEDDSDGEREAGGEEERRRDRVEERGRDREEERGVTLDKPTGRSVRFADMAPPPVVRERRKKRVVKKSKAITPLQAMMLRMAGQSVPEEEEEEEEEEEYTDASDESDTDDKLPPADSQPVLPLANTRLPPPAAPMGSQQPVTHMQSTPITGPPPLGPPPVPPMRPPGPPSGPPPGPPPGAPPFLRPMGIPAGLRGPLPRLLPPGPPPGRPPGPPPGPPPRGPPPRLPPPAPPGTSAPPQPGPTPTNPPAHHHAPTIEKRANITSIAASNPAAGGATISAKPQIINPKAEVTRFVPTALRVRRERGGASGGGPERAGRKGPEEGAGPKQQQQPMGAHASSANPTHMGVASAPQPSMKTKDQMYEAFMREMEGLL